MEPAKPTGQLLATMVSNPRVWVKTLRNDIQFLMFILTLILRPQILLHHAPATIQERPTPAPVTQLAWLLHSILPQALDDNMEILTRLSSSSASSRSDLNAENLDHDTFAHLAGYLALLSNILAQRSAARKEVSEDLVRYNAGIF